MSNSESSGPACCPAAPASPPSCRGPAAAPADRPDEDPAGQYCTTATPVCATATPAPLALLVTWPGATAVLQPATAAASGAPAAPWAVPAPRPPPPLPPLVFAAAPLGVAVAVATAALSDPGVPEAVAVAALSARRGSLTRGVPAPPSEGLPLPGAASGSSRLGPDPDPDPDPDPAAPAELTCVLSLPATASAAAVVAVAVAALSGSDPRSTPPLPGPTPATEPEAAAAAGAPGDGWPPTAVVAAATAPTVVLPSPRGSSHPSHAPADRTAPQPVHVGVSWVSLPVDADSPAEELRWEGGGGGSGCELQPGVSEPDRRRGSMTLDGRGELAGMAVDVAVGGGGGGGGRPGLS